MLTETGLVIAVDHPHAEVETKSQLVCSSCRVSSSCGNGILEKYLTGKIFVSKLLNPMSAKVGDQVIIEVPKASVTKAAIIVYLLPLLFLFVATISADTIKGSENQTIIAGILGLILGLFVTKYYNRKWLNSELYLPKIVSIVDTVGHTSDELNSSVRIHTITID